MLSVSCPRCSHKMKAPQELVGRTAKCGNCGETFVIQDDPHPGVQFFEPLASPGPPTTFRPTRRDETQIADDTSGWHYVHDGRSVGPVSTIELREMAIAGTLQPSDLVWKQGMENWVAAGQVTGLMRRSSPPPIPTAVQTAPPIGRGTSADVAPPLWNPGAAGIWSLFLPWAMGALLVALNWRALGEPEKAKRAMVWFYAALAFMLMLPLLAMFEGSAPLTSLFYLFGNPTALLIWNWAECERQRKLLKRLFDNRYPRRWLIVPILITIVLTFGFFVICGAFLAALTVVERAR
jgi:GYF domain 2